jgi:hypothetical protein
VTDLPARTVEEQAAGKSTRELCAFLILVYEVRSWMDMTGTAIYRAAEDELLNRIKSSADKGRSVIQILASGSRHE